MQVDGVQKVDLELCQALIDFLKRGNFTIGALDSHRLSNTMKWVSALANAIAIAHDKEQGRGIPAGAEKVGKKSGLKIKSITPNTPPSGG
jgi:hypothetical protein